MKREDVVVALEAIIEPVSSYGAGFFRRRDTIYIMDQVEMENDGDLVKRNLQNRRSVIWESGKKIPPQ